MIEVTCMWFLLITVLFHESHEEDENYRGGRNANDNWDNNNSPSNIGTHSDISISYSHLRDNLIIKASDKSV